MRPSNRDQVVEAALALVTEVGLQGTTFDAIAARTGLSKGGILYHFPSKDALITAMIGHIVAGWDADAESHLTVPFDEASQEQRVLALMLSMVHDQTIPGYVAFLTEVSRSGILAEAWRDLRARWVGDGSGMTTDQHIALLAADGLWLNDAIQSNEVSPADRLRVIARLHEMTGAVTTPSA